MGSRVYEIRKGAAFFITALLLLSIGLLLLGTTDKAEFHISTNDIHSTFLDYIFVALTMMGDGVVVPILVLVLAIVSFRKKKFSTIVLAGSVMVLASIFAQSLKRMVYHEALRPRAFIGDDKLDIISWIDVHSHNSFPSGHTTLSFAVCSFLALFYFSENKKAQIVLAILAALIGFSRIYLNQHFLEDVVAGGFLGLLACLVVMWMNNILVRK